MTYSANELAREVTRRTGRAIAPDTVSRWMRVGLLPDRTDGWGRAAAFTEQDLERAVMLATLRERFSGQRLRRAFQGQDTRGRREGQIMGEIRFTYQELGLRGTETDREIRDHLLGLAARNGHGAESQWECPDATPAMVAAAERGDTHSQDFIRRARQLAAMAPFEPPIASEAIIGAYRAYESAARLDGRTATLPHDSRVQ